jgi:hypothetical protein
VTGRPQAVGGKRFAVSRMILIAAVWILVCWLGRRFALDRVLTSAVTRNFDDQLEYVMNALVNSAEIDPGGRSDLQPRSRATSASSNPNSGLYWQVRARVARISRRAALWDRSLALARQRSRARAVIYDSEQFPDEPLRVANATVYLPGATPAGGSPVAQSRDELDAQIGEIRRSWCAASRCWGSG